MDAKRFRGRGPISAAMQERRFEQGWLNHAQKVIQQISTVLDGDVLARPVRGGEF